MCFFDKIIIMETNIYSTIFFIVIIIEVSIAVVIFLGNKHFSAKVFSALILLHAVWVTAEGFLHGTTDPSIANFLVVYIHYLVGAIATAFFYFALSYPEDKHPSWKFFTGLIALQILLLPFYGAGLVIEKASYVDGLQQWGWDWGMLRYIFHATFFGSLGASLMVLYSKLRKASQENKKSITFLLAAMTLTVLPVSIITIILPTFDIFTYRWIGSILSLVWISVLAYSILKLHKMNTRAVLVEIFILAASAILFLNIFITETESSNAIVSTEVVVRTIIFIASFVGGYLLIVNILKESEQKESIKNLNTKLGTLNEELEDKVNERTKDLSISKKHIETILENLTIGIIEFDTDFTIFRINKTAEVLLGTTREKTVGKRISPEEKTHLRSLSKIMFDWQTEKHTEKSGKSITYNEVTLDYPKKKELQIVTIPIRKVPYVKIFGFIKLLRDVTYEKAVNREKNEFISIVAHQLNTPLDATQWALETVLTEETTLKQKELLEKILSTNNNLSQITTDLLNTARIDGGEFTFDLKKNNIANVVKKYVKNFSSKATEKKIRLTFTNKTPDLPEFLFNPEKMGIVFKNILTNAIDYTPEGGSISVTLTHSNDGYVVIIIRDTGIGIPKEELNRLFTKFYRSKEALLMETDRSGLGLYITKNIIDKHQGQISIESEKGAGVTVTIRLPIHTEETVTQ